AMDLLLPGPPLAEWLMAMFAGKKMSLWTGPGAGRGRPGRTARATVAAIAEQAGWQALAGAGGAGGGGGLPALGAAEELPEAGLGSVRAGGHVVELAHAPPVELWRPTRWARRGALVREAAASRAGLWLGRGCFALEQWRPVDMPRLLVTSGQVRAIPGR